MNRLDLDLSARTIYGEARGEGAEGMLAVAWVLWNRLKSGRWGATLAQVCLAHAQFSCWLQSDPNYPLVTSVADTDIVLMQCAQALASVAASVDPTGGALFYFARTISRPHWSRAMTRTAVIGHHEFYK